MRAPSPSRMSRSALSFLSSCGVFLVALVASFSQPLEAQVLRRQPTPFSVWIDLREIAAAKGNRAAALPIWLDSVQFEAHPSKPDAPAASSIYRFHFRRMA